MRLCLKYRTLLLEPYACSRTGMVLRACNQSTASRPGPKAREGASEQFVDSFRCDARWSGVAWFEQVAQRVRWKILGELPFVADVMVNIAVETKPCPAMSSLRPQEDIEQVGLTAVPSTVPPLLVLLLVLLFVLLVVASSRELFVLGG